MKEAVISHETDLEDLRGIDFSGLIPEVVLRGRIPVMITEHCFASKAGSSKGSFLKSEHYACKAATTEWADPTGSNYREKSCLRCSRGKGGDLLLKDRKGQIYPVVEDSERCRTTILSFRERDMERVKEELKKLGISRFKIYVY